MNQQNYLTDAQRQSENTNANRQANVALNRQGVTQGNQQTRFGQGTQTLNTLSGIWGNVADARRQGEGEARQFNAGMFGQTGNWGNQNQQTQVQGFSAGTDASANAQRNGNAAASRPSRPTRFSHPRSALVGSVHGLDCVIHLRVLRLLHANPMRWVVW